MKRLLLLLLLIGSISAYANHQVVPTRLLNQTYIYADATTDNIWVPSTSDNYRIIDEYGGPPLLLWEDSRSIWDTSTGQFGESATINVWVHHWAEVLPESVQVVAGGQLLGGAIVKCPQELGGLCGSGFYEGIINSFFEYTFVPTVDMYYDLSALVGTNINPINTAAAGQSAEFLFMERDKYTSDVEVLMHLGSGVGFDPGYINGDDRTGVLLAGNTYTLSAQGYTQCAICDWDTPSSSPLAEWRVFSFYISLLLSATPNIVRPPDADRDGVSDSNDAYPNISLGGRKDTDHDGIPNDCDVLCIYFGMVADDNDDNDIHIDTADNCPLVVNDDQVNSNNDGIGDACDPDDDGLPDDLDNCPVVTNPNQADSNNDGVGDACDPDSDRVRSNVDNCPLISNRNQLDSDDNGRGDACESLPPGC